MGAGEGVGVGVGVGVGDGVGDGLGDGVAMTLGEVSESGELEAGKTVTVTKNSAFPFETVIVCAPASAAGTVNVLLKPPVLSTVAVSNWVPSHRITALPGVYHLPISMSAVPVSTVTVAVKSVLFPYNPDATALPTCANPLRNSLKGVVAL